MTEKHDILTNTDKKFLTARELGEIFGVGEKVVLGWARNGMPHLKMSARMIRFEWDKVKAYLERGNKL